LRNHAKFGQNLTLRQFKVVQGHRSWCQSKAHIRDTLLMSCVMYSHQQKLQNIKQKIKEAESTRQDSAQVEILSSFLESYLY